MKITAIEKDGIARKLGFKAGDDIEKINDHVIHDILDFQFRYSDEKVKMQVRRAGRSFVIEFEPGDNNRFGAEFETFHYKNCGNNCVFCFVDQNPKGLRSSLYFKDEDYRLSFLYGNYITLTSVTQKELDRIVHQRLSPLYISVHALDPAVRSKILGLRRPDKLKEKLAFLASHRIEMHAQIVLCPGLNDGCVLDATLDGLALFYPRLKTVAVVPVGLTRHRQGLAPLRGVDRNYAKNLVVWYEKKIDSYQKKLDNTFVYLADEFYLLANEPFPPVSFYDEFYQIENGVGMVREFLQSLSDLKTVLPDSVSQKNIVIATGRLAGPILKRHVLPVLRNIRQLNVDVVEIENIFYGPGVTVSGLMVGQDIAAQLKSFIKKDLILLPSNCTNDTGLFLDDWTIPQLEEKIRVRVEQLSDIQDIFEIL